MRMSFGLASEYGRPSSPDRGHIRFPHNYRMMLKVCTYPSRPRLYGASVERPEYLGR